MKVLVTGGAGYVGSACLRYMLKHGEDPIAYDNLSQGHREAIPEDRLIVGDINETDALEKTLRETGAEAVMHFAAATTVGDSVTDPDWHYYNNINGTRSLLNAMRKSGVKRMLFSSTCATYGMNPKLPMAEDSDQDPCNPYARTKLAIEWMIRDFAHAYGFGFTLLRYFNAAGADADGEYGQDHRPFSHIIPIVLQVALGLREEVQVFGTDYPTLDGTCIRDYVHTEDLAQAHLLAIRATTAETAEVFNIGTGNGNSVLEIIRACEEVTGEKIPMRFVDRREGDPPALVADPSKLKNQLGWQPKYPAIVETVSTAWKWHKSHPDGYRSNVAVSS